MTHSRILFVLLVLFTLGTPAISRAATYTWDGPASGGNWYDAANWQYDVDPSDPSPPLPGIGDIVDTGVDPARLIIFDPVAEGLPTDTEVDILELRGETTLKIQSGLLRTFDAHNSNMTVWVLGGSSVFETTADTSVKGLIFQQGRVRPQADLAVGVSIEWPSFNEGFVDGLGSLTILATCTATIGTTGFGLNLQNGADLFVAGTLDVGRGRLRQGGGSEVTIRSSGSLIVDGGGARWTGAPGTPRVAVNNGTIDFGFSTPGQTTELVWIDLRNELGAQIDLGPGTVDFRNDGGTRTGNFFNDGNINTGPFSPGGPSGYLDLTNCQTADFGVNSVVTGAKIGLSDGTIDALSSNWTVLETGLRYTSTVTFNGDWSFPILDVNGANIQHAGNIEVTDQMVQIVNGRTRFFGGGTFELAAGATTNPLPFSIEFRGVDATIDGAMVIRGGGGGLLQSAGSSLTINGELRFEQNAAWSGSDDVGSETAINNGLITVDMPGSNVQWVDVNITNNGTIQIDGGRVLFNSGNNNGGTLVNATTGTIDVGATSGSADAFLDLGQAQGWDFVAGSTTRGRQVSLGLRDEVPGFTQTIAGTWEVTNTLIQRTYTFPTATFIGDYELPNLVLDSATLVTTAGNSVTVTESVDLSGTISGPGTVVIASTVDPGDGLITGISFFDEVAIEIEGTLLQTTVNNLLQRNGAAVTVRPGGRFEFQTNAFGNGWRNDDADPATLSPVSIQSGGVLAFNAGTRNWVLRGLDITNEGALEVLSGIVQSDGGKGVELVTSGPDGRVDVGAGALLNLSNAALALFETGSTAEGPAGEVRLGDATVRGSWNVGTTTIAQNKTATFDGDFTLQNLTVDGGTLATTSSLVVGGAFETPQFRSATFVGAGAGTPNLVFADASPHVARGSLAFDNVAFGLSGELTTGSGVNINMQNGATFDVATTGALTIGNTAPVFRWRNTDVDGISYSTVSNAGSIVFDITDTVFLLERLDITNDGTIDFASGGVRCQQGSAPIIVSNGAITVAPGVEANLQYSQATFTAGSTTTGGELILGDATVEGVWDVTSTVVSQNSVANFLGIYDLVDINLSSGSTLASTGGLRVLSSAAIAGATTLQGPGPFTLESGAQALGSQPVTLVDTDLTVAGEWQFANSRELIQQSGSSVEITETGILRFDAVGGWRGIDPGGRALPVTAINRGRIENVTDRAVRIFDVQIDNQGTIAVDGGRIEINAPFDLNLDPATGILVQGTYDLAGELRIQDYDTNPITRNDATIILRNAAGDIRSSNFGTSGLRTLSEVGAGGVLQLEGGASLNPLTPPLLGEGLVIASDGTIGGDFTNVGTLQLDPGPGLNVTGAFTQTAAGTLVTTALGDATRDDYGSLDAGTAALAGTIQLDFDPGFDPTLGAEFVLLQYGGFTGAFNDELLPPPGDLEWVTETAVDSYRARLAGYYNAVSLDLGGGNVQRVDANGGLAAAGPALGTLSGAPTAGRLAGLRDGTRLFAVLDDGATQTAAALDPFTGEVLSESVTVDDVAGVAVAPTATDFVGLADGDGLAFELFISRGGITATARDGSTGRATQLGRLDVDRGVVEGADAITFTGSEVDPEAELIAYSPDNELFALDATGSGPRLWTIDLAEKEASLVGTIADPAVDAADAMAFLGNQLWALVSSTGVAYEIDPTVATVVQSRTLSAGLSGLTNRACFERTSSLVAYDAAADGGGAIELAWPSYTLPTGTIRFDVYRAVDACALVLGGEEFVGSLATPTDAAYVDGSATDYRTYSYRIDAIGESGGEEFVIESLFSAPVFSYPNVVISELGRSFPGLPRRVGERVELQNLSSDPIDLTGWRLSNGNASEALTGVITGDGFLVWTLTAVILDPEGDRLTLLPPDSNFQVDLLAYGSEGGAPSAPEGFTISRVPGTTSEDPISTSFSIGPETFGASNQAQAPQLGSSLVINEVGYTGVAGEDYVELFNPLGSTVRLDAFVVTNGPAFADTLETPLSLDAGDLIALGASGPIGFDRDIEREQLYLYRLVDGQPPLLVDQVGWGPGDDDPVPPDPIVPRTALVRVPDGIAVYLGDRGANWLDSGGGEFLDYGLPTPGLPNIPPDFIPVTVDPAGGGDYTDLATALAAVDAGTAVLLEEGTYDGPVTVPEGVALIGQAERSTQVIVGSPTGAGAATVTVEGSDPTTRVANLTIRSSGNRALDLVNSFATIQSVRFVENVTELDGAAVRIAGGAPRFDGCTFTRNASEGNGGAVLVESGAPIFERTLFYENTAVGAGGAIHIASGTASIDRSVFDSNASAVGTGCVHVAAGDASVRTSFVTNTEGGAAIVAEAGATGSLSCSVVFANGGLVDPETVAVADVVDADPQYCAPAALDFGYPEGSPADVLSQTCGVNVGITGSGCANFATTTPPSAITQTRLEKTVPNPFNPRTSVRFALAERGRVDLMVYDLRGREVTRLIRGEEVAAGSHEIVWGGVDDEGRRVSSGVYLVQLRVDGTVRGPALKTTLLK